MQVKNLTTCQPTQQRLQMNSIMQELDLKANSSVLELSVILSTISHMDYLTLARLQDSFVLIVNRYLKLWDSQFKPVLTSNPNLKEAIGLLKLNVEKSLMLNESFDILRDKKLYELLSLTEIFIKSEDFDTIDPFAAVLFNLCFELSWRSKSSIFWESFVTNFYILYPEEALIFEQILLPYLAWTCHTPLEPKHRC